MPVSPTPTPAQSEASRLNGARGHGPATPEGKARSALNGMRHGLRGATFALLPDEDPAAWAAVLAGYPAASTAPVWLRQLFRLDSRRAAEVLVGGLASLPGHDRATRALILPNL